MSAFYSMKPILAITMGDPAGVGPEVAVGALGNSRINDLCQPILKGDSFVLEKTLDPVNFSIHT